MILDRRQVLAGIGTGLVAAPAIVRAQMMWRDYPFSLGVAAGDPLPDGFVIWTRLAPDPLGDQGAMPMRPVEVEWEVAADEGFRTIARKGVAVARPELAHSVHVEVAGLAPGRTWFYRFRCGTERSINGRARTMPAAGAALDRVRFGVAGCQNYEDGLYTAYRHLAAEPDVDFVFHYGDYIYEYLRAPVHYRSGRLDPPVRKHVGGPSFGLDDYRRRYAQYKLDYDLQAAHAAHAFCMTYDDHEVANDWVSDHDAAGAPAEDFLLRRAYAFQAWYEHQPVRAAQRPRLGGGVQLYRRRTYGDLLQLNLCDTRQYRTDQPCGGGFDADCPEDAAAGAAVLGEAQEKWLVEGLRAGGTRWSAVAQQVMMMRIDRRTSPDAAPGPIRNMDSWAGYLAPRDRLLGAMKGLGNVVVLTGDEHQNHAGLPAPSTRPDAPVAVEFVATSISSGGDGSDRRAGAEQVIAGSPELRWTNDQRGYLLCDVGRDRWETRFRVVDAVSRPDRPIATRATAVVEHGRVAIEGLA